MSRNNTSKATLKSKPTDKLREFFIFEPHNAIISGVTNSGKTHFVLDLLETYYLGHFENIVLFCPTFDFNDTYNRRWVFKDKNFIVLNPKSVRSNLNHVILICTEVFKGSNSLFIIDDCANLQDSKRKATEICNLAFSGRHYGITTWVLIQKYNSIVKDFRENIRFLILFYNKDENAMKNALEENAVIPREQRDNVIRFLKENKTAKLLIRLQYPREFLLFK